MSATGDQSTHALQVLADDASDGAEQRRQRQADNDRELDLPGVRARRMRLLEDEPGRDFVWVDGRRQACDDRADGSEVGHRGAQKTLCRRCGASAGEGRRSQAQSGMPRRGVARPAQGIAHEERLRAQRASKRLLC